MTRISPQQLTSLPDVLIAQAFISLGVGKTGADGGQVEVIRHLPGKASVQYRVVIDSLVSVLTAVGLLFLYH